MTTRGHVPRLLNHLAYDELQELFKEADQEAAQAAASGDPASVATDTAIQGTEFEDSDFEPVDWSSEDADLPNLPNLRTGQLLPYNEINYQQANLIFRLRSIVNKVEELHIGGVLLGTDETEQLGLAIRVLDKAVDPKIGLSCDFNDAINYAGPSVASRAEADGGLKSATVFAVHLVDGLIVTGAMQLAMNIENLRITARSGVTEAQLLFGQMLRVDQRCEYDGIDILTMIIVLRARKSPGRRKGSDEDYVPWSEVRKAYFKLLDLHHDERTLRG